MRKAEEPSMILLADTYFNMKQYDKALETYRLCLTTFPKEINLWMLIMELFRFICLKRYDEALLGAKQADVLFGTQLEMEMSKKIQLDREQKR